MTIGINHNEPMARTAPRQLKIGDPLLGTVVKSFGGNRFAVNSSQAPRGWKVELHTTRPELVNPGEQRSFWIGRINPLKGEVLVYEGDTGRLPISDAMGARYRSAMEAMLGQTELTGDLLGDARTMVARIGNQRNADWLTVYRLLGEPTNGETKELLNALDEIRGARKNNEENQVELLSKFIEAHGRRFERAIQRLAKVGL